MGINTEIFIKVAGIKPVRENKIELYKVDGRFYYDKDGKEIDVYMRRKWEIVDHLVCYNEKEISIEFLEKEFNSKNSLKVEFSIAEGSTLYISLHVEDSITLNILIEALSEFLYDIFDKEMEF